MSLLLLLLSAIPSSGARELLIPVTPNSAVYAEGLTSSRLPVSYLFNPALAARKPYFCVHLSHAEWFVGTRRERVDVLMPFSWGTLSMGGSGFHVWNLEGRDTPDSPPDTFAAYNTDFGVRYARTLLEGRLALGGGLGWIMQGIGSYSTWALHASLGADYFFGKFSVGASILNLGTPLHLDSSAAPLPTRFQLGSSWNINERFDAQLGGAVGLDGSYDVSAGVAGYFFKVLRLDLGGGYGAHPHLGAGLGIELSRFQLGYATSLRFGIGFSHHVGVHLIFPPAQHEDPQLVLMMQTSRTFTEIGKRDMAERDYSHALDQFDLALIWWPDNEEAQNGYEGALEKLREQRIEDHLDAAREYSAAGEYLDALRQYEFVITLDVGNVEALSGRADMQLKLQEIPILSNAEVPPEAVKLFEAGVQSFRSDDFKQAKAYWQELAQRFPDIAEITAYIELSDERMGEKIDSLLLASYAARERDALRQALTLVEKVLEIEPTERRALTLREELKTISNRRASELLQQALDFYDDRRYELAAERFHEVLAIDPTDVTSQRYLARMEKEAKLRRNDLEELNNRATNAYTIEDYDTAIRIWEQIIAVDSTFPNVQRNLERARRKKEFLSNGPP